MAKKLESTLINMILSLVLISVAMSTALVLVYLKTRGPIEVASRQKEIEAIKQVLPEFDSDPMTGKTEQDGVIIYSLNKQNRTVGYAIKTYTDKGFGGHVELMAGFLPDGSINKVTVLTHKETPGLGTKMSDPRFADQFTGKNPADFVLKVRKDGGQVDAITAATVSSRAYCDALQRAYANLSAMNDSISVK